MKKSLVVLFVFFGASASAQEVPDLFRDVADYASVPQVLLYAVATHESGRTVGNVRSPHPWTLNIQGRGYYYKTRKEQFDALMKNLPNTSRIDVSYMQINWRWYHEKLIDPWIATDPGFNLKTGAQILSEHHRYLKDWKAATAQYHTTIPDVGRKYAERVWLELQGICERPKLDGVEIAECLELL